MIAWIKKHWVLLSVATGGLVLLYWLYKSGYLSSSSSASTSCAPGDPTCDPNYASYLQSAQNGVGGGSGGGGSASQPTTGLVNLLSSNPATPGGAVVQPGTSSSGVPSYSPLTQEASPNTPNPSLPPVATAATNGIVNAANASPLSGVQGSDNPAVYTTNAYIEGLNQNVAAIQSNEGLAPGFTQSQFNSIYSMDINAAGGPNFTQFANDLGERNVIAPGTVVNEEYAAAGLTSAAIDAGATITGFGPNGQAMVNWGGYSGPGSPGYVAPTAPPPTTTTPPPTRTPPSFTNGNGIPNPSNNRNLPPASTAPPNTPPSTIPARPPTKFIPNPGIHNRSTGAVDITTIPISPTVQ